MSSVALAIKIPMSILNLRMKRAKGQLISKGLLGVIVSTKKTMIFLRISALASENSSNQKTLLYNYVE
jgi:hypothetical protein